MEQFSDRIAQQQSVMNDHMTAALPLPIDLTNATGTYLDLLNDDCLLEIFSTNSLTPLDLCSLAETCKLFKRITQRLFPKKLSIQKDNCIRHDAEPEDYVYIRESVHVKRIFKNFASSLVAVSLFGRGVVADCDSKMFANWGSLTELRIEHVENCNDIMTNNFPKLQRFRLFYKILGAAFDIGRILLNFCERNRALKCLDLSTHGCGPDFVQKLGNIRKELEELDIEEVNSIHGAMDFSNFHNLKRLVLRRFNFGGEKCSVQLQNLKSLEVLKIFGAFDSKAWLNALPLLTNLRELWVDVGQSISERIPWASLTQLTTLRLSSSNHTIDNIIDLIRQLINLEKLEVATGISELSVEQFLEIAEVVKGRPNVLALKCGCSYELVVEYLTKICNEENLKVNLI